MTQTQLTSKFHLRIIVILIVFLWYLVNICFLKYIIIIEVKTQTKTIELYDMIILTLQATQGSDDKCDTHSLCCTVPATRMD